jgi:hypothetical protein
MPTTTSGNIRHSAAVEKPAEKIRSITCSSESAASFFSREASPLDSAALRPDPRKDHAQPPSSTTVDDIKRSPPFWTPGRSPAAPSQVFPARYLRSGWSQMLVVSRALRTKCNPQRFAEQIRQSSGPIPWFRRMPRVNVFT